MSFPINLDQRLEVRDASGATVGFILSDQQTRDLITERDALRKQVAELQRQTAALHDQAARLKAERDGYLESLHFLTRQNLTPLTEPELAELNRDGLPFEQLLPEMEQVVGLKARGD